MSNPSEQTIVIQQSIEAIPAQQHAEWAAHAEGVLTLASFARVNGIELDGDNGLEELAAKLLSHVDEQARHKGWWATEKRRMQSDALLYAY